MQCNAEIVYANMQDKFLPRSFAQNNICGRGIKRIVLHANVSAFACHKGSGQNGSGKGKDII